MNLIPLNIQSALLVYGPLGLYALGVTMFAIKASLKLLESHEARRKDGERIITALSFSSEAHRESAEAHKEVSQALERQQATMEGLRLQLELMGEIKRRQA